MPEHIVPKTLYFIIFGVLISLTALTIYVAGFDLGPLNTVAALAIAVLKALLVVLFFMHVRYSSRLTQVVVGVGLLWLAIMIILIMGDYLTRKQAPGPPRPNQEVAVDSRSATLQVRTRRDARAPASMSSRT